MQSGQYQSGEASTPINQKIPKIIHNEQNEENQNESAYFQSEHISEERLREIKEEQEFNVH